MSNGNTEDHDRETGEILTPLVAATSVGQIVGAEVDLQIATAKKYPRRRDLDISKEIMGRATLNTEIATECVYQLKRDDKAIIGPSIRFAEIVRASFGNIRVAARFLRIDDDDPRRAAVVVEAICMDLQTNNAEAVPVRRSIMTSGKGGRVPRMFNADMTNTTVQAAVSIARRNAILATIPKAVWIDAYYAALDVIRGDARTLGERRAKAVTELGKLGVEPADLFAALGVAGEADIGLDHMPTLAGMYTALREGETVDSVLGRMGTQDREAKPVVENPLARQTGPDAGKSVAQEQQKGSYPASNDGGKTDVAQNGVAAVAERGSGGEVATTGSDQANAQAAPGPGLAGTKPADASQPSGAGYFQAALAKIENSVSAGRMRDEWKADRATREAANLSSTALEELIAAMESKRMALEGQAS